MKFISLCLVAIFVICMTVPSHQHGHSHDDHDHHHGHHHSHDEHPSFKYSKQANEPKKADNAHNHGHVHSHSHGHDDHHHGHHHSHDHHGHAHDHDHHHGHHHSHESEEQPKKRSAEPTIKKAAPPKRDKMSIATHAVLSTLLISVAPFFILFFIPINNNGIENQSLLKVLLGFASGSLLGDAFLHLIPHALSPHDHSDESHSHSHTHSHAGEPHNHSHQTTVGLWVLAGIITFLIVEKAVRHLNGGENGSHAHSHSHGHSHSSDKKEKEPTPDKSEKKDEKKSSKDDKDEDKKKNKDKKCEEPVKQEINIAGYLNLAADFAHNFTDGLAIGASFLAGQNIGIITTATILFHEVPHEIGDFAILIQSGCSKKKAIFLQLLTALGALSGTILSLVFESAMTGFASSCILPFTAGGFMYIATVSIIPELKESSSILQSIKELVALACGILMMVIIGQYE